MLLILGQETYCSVAKALVSTECFQVIVRASTAPGLTHSSLKWTSKAFVVMIMLLYLIRRGKVVLCNSLNSMQPLFIYLKTTTAHEESAVEMPKI